MVWSAASAEPFVDFVSRAGVGQTSEHGAALAYGTKPPPTVAGASTAPSPQPRAPAAAATYPPPPPPQPYPPHAQLRLQPSFALAYRESGGYSRGGGGGGGGGGGDGYNVRVVGAGGNTGRLSLLPATGYLAPPPPAPPADPPPFKKIRLSAERPHLVHHHTAPAHHQMLQHHHQQLRVDTREPVNAYNNTVEVLSPNPPPELTGEDQSFRTTKDDLLQQISKVDREMALSEQTLAKLKRKHEELEQAASRPAVSEEPEVEQPKHRSLTQSVLADNMKKAERAHAELARLRTPEQTEKWPLYNQPQDTEVYHANKAKHLALRPRLLEHLRRAKKEQEQKRQAFADAYAKRAADWLRRVERIEQGQKRKAKEARNREFFEKVFPELRKQREDRERFNRVGARVKSEADLEEIVDGLQEQEMEEKKMRSLAVVPPLAFHCRRRTMYTDTNGICTDMEEEHKELTHHNVWTQQERDLFKEKYLQHPKNFGVIASFFTRKSVRDCVRFYYLSKKTEIYKQLLRKSRQRRSARNPARNLQVPAPDLPAGVTTRLQRSQGTGPRASEKDLGAEEGGATVGLTLTCIPVPPDSVPLPPDAPPADDAPDPLNPCDVPLPRTPPLPPSPPPAQANLATSTPTPTGGVGPGVAAISTASALAAVTSISTPTTPRVASPHPLAPPPESAMAAVTVTTPPATRAATPTTVAVSATIAVVPSPQPAPVQHVPQPPVAAASPAPPPASAPGVLAAAMSPHQPQHPQQQLLQQQPQQQLLQQQPQQQPQQQLLHQQQQQQQQPPENGVVERLPMTTVVVQTASSTPMSSACVVCGGAGTRGVSRARAHYYGLREDAVPPGARVCETCHCKCVRSRYTRCPVPTCPGPKVRAKRLRHLPPRWHDLPHEVKAPVMEEFQIPSELSKCCLACFKRITRRIETEGAAEPTEEEANRFRTLLREHGTEWSAMAAAAGRTPAHLKAFYFSYRKRFGLDSLVAERDTRERKDERDRDRDRSSDDEDSGAATSCDTDTASAESPRPPPPPEPAPKLRPPVPHHPSDPYDSSATETADEENDAPAARHSPKHVPVAPHQQPPPSAPQPPPALPVSAAPPQRNGPAPPSTTGAPITVHDVVLNMIEFSLSKNSVPPAVKPQQQPVKSLECRPAAAPREALATLSVVNSQHVNSASAAPRSPHRPATITPVAQPPPPASDAPKEGVVIVQIESRRAPDQEPLLDLSLKRPRDRAFPPPHPAKHPQPVALYRNSTDSYSYRPAPDRDSPTAHYQLHPQPKQNKILPPRPAPKPILNPKGSITHGTPVDSNAASPRFDNTPRRTPPDTKVGSITAGTPVHAPHHLSEKRAYDYYKQRRSPGGPTAFYTSPSGQPVSGPRAQSPQSFAATASPYSRGPYGLEQRQIIMADYITSQQMHGGVRRTSSGGGSVTPGGTTIATTTERSSSPQYSPGVQRREGVIQRHTPHPPPHTPPAPHPSHPAHPAHPSHSSHHQTQHYQQLPPGHEAFSSLVDVAVAAPSLPVPRAPVADTKPAAPPDKHAPTSSPSSINHMPSHELRMQERIHRDMAQKYHHQQIQFQAIERERRAHHAQYMDRQMQAMQQGRERERAMAVLQERQLLEQHQQQQHQQQQHQQHQQHQQQQQQQLMQHERHHLPHQSQVVTSEERRTLGAASTPAAYSTARHMQPPPHSQHSQHPQHHHLERKDSRVVVSSSAPVVVSAASSNVVSASAGVSGAGVGEARAALQRAEGTLTAASLIDAIITHQINQTSTEPGVRVDPARNIQTLIAGRDPEPVTSVAVSIAASSVGGGVAGGGGPREAVPDSVSQNTTSFKLGDLASNIITRDFCSPTHLYSRYNSNPQESVVSAGGGAGFVSGGGGATERGGEEWKRAAAPPPKHAPYLEPVSPPDNHHHINRGGTSRRYAGAGSALTAYDYVANRIVEVMRGGGEEEPVRKTSAPSIVGPFQPTAYAYPFSALNVATTDAAAAPAPPPAHPAPHPPAPEPAPLMSAQYEPLSDED